MNRRREEVHGDELAKWEQWPLAALFAANALNVFILYVPLEEMPESIRWLLPWVKVICGIAAALSLDGTLISVTMGRRLGRTSKWSWATIVATGVFTAAVAWYVHHAVGAAAAILFMSQAVILVLYGQHLAQPRKPLTPVVSSVVAVNRGELVSTAELADIAAARPSAEDLTERGIYPAPVLSHQPKLRACKHCGEILPISTLGSHGRNFKRWGNCRRL